MICYDLRDPISPILLLFVHAPSTNAKNFLIQPDRLIEIFIILRMFNDAFIPSEQPSRIRLYVFAYWNSPETDEHLLTFFRQQKIYEQLTGVGMRRFSGQHHGIHLNRNWFERNPIYGMAF